MYITISHYIKVIAVVFSLLLFSGCGARLKTVPAEPQSDYSLEIEIIEPEIDSSYQYAEQLEQDSIPTLLEKALKASESEDFFQADSLLRQAVKLVETSRDYDEISWLPVEQYLNAIVEIYTNHLPKDYPIPEQISVLVFQQRLYQSIGTLEVEPEDSLILLRLAAQSNHFDVPVVWNERVQQSLLFFMRSRRGIFDRWLRRAGYYLPVKKQMFADAGLPQDLAYLPILESGFNPHAYSHAHASGIWQFIPATGRRYGLRQNYWIDERRDPLKSAHAAIGYLSKLYDDFGCWYLALAAYNCGEGRMGRTIRRDETNDYWELSLPRETMNYVPLYLATLIVAKNPEIFNFTFSEDFRFDLDTVYVNDCIGLSTIAEGLNIPQDTLKRINPHILRWCTPPDMEKILLYLPAGYAEPFREFYRQLPDEEKVRWYRYRVRRGDNLIGIARSFGVPVEAIRSINNLRSNTIIAGHHLYIPLPLNVKTPQQQPSSQAASTRCASTGGQKFSYTVRSGDVMGRIANSFDVSVEDLLRWNNLRKPEDLRAGQSLTIYRQAAQPRIVSAPQDMAQYIVQSGDSPYTISQKLGVSLNELLRANNFSSGNPRIFPGDVLYYPLSGQKTATAPRLPHQQQPRSTQPQRTIEYRVARGDNLSRIAKLFSVSIQSVMELNNLTSDSVLNIGQIIKIPSPDPSANSSDNETQSYHLIKQGDTLWAIASHFNVPLETLYKLNNLESGSMLIPGNIITTSSKGE